MASPSSIYSSWARLNRSDRRRSALFGPTSGRLWIGVKKTNCTWRSSCHNLAPRPSLQIILKAEFLPFYPSVIKQACVSIGQPWTIPVLRSMSKPLASENHENHVQTMSIGEKWAENYEQFMSIGEPSRAIQLNAVSKLNPKTKIQTICQEIKEKAASSALSGNKSKVNLKISVV